MKVSTKARYALRALLDLAIYTIGEPVPLLYIAERQKLSVNYLEQVFALIKKAGIVKSIKGSQGGYLLARQPKDITVGEVIRAIEGEILLVDEEKMSSNDSLLYRNLEICLQEKVWGPMTQSVCEVVDHITLDDLIRDEQKLRQYEEIMYYI